MKPQYFIGHTRPDTREHTTRTFALLVDLSCHMTLAWYTWPPTPQSCNCICVHSPCPHSTIPCRAAHGHRAESQPKPQTWAHPAYPNERPPLLCRKQKPSRSREADWTKGRQPPSLPLRNHVTHKLITDHSPCNRLFLFGPRRPATCQSPPLRVLLI